jgi:hypothetical protein
MRASAAAPAIHVLIIVRIPFLAVLRAQPRGIDPAPIFVETRGRLGNCDRMTGMP